MCLITTHASLFGSQFYMVLVSFLVMSYISVTKKRDVISAAARNRIIFIELLAMKATLNTVSKTNFKESENIGQQFFAKSLIILASISYDSKPEIGEHRVCQLGHHTHFDRAREALCVCVSPIGTGGHGSSGGWAVRCVCGKGHGKKPSSAARAIMCSLVCAPKRSRSLEQTQYTRRISIPRSKAIS